jgi:hypothetical protein
MLGRLFGKTAAPEDLLVSRLPEIPVSISEAGSFVDGYEEDPSQSGLVKAKGSREGALAQYQLQWNRPRDKVYAQLSAEDPTPFVQWVRQLIVLLTDADAAARWFRAKSIVFNEYKGRTIEGFRYGQVEVVSGLDIGDEAALLTVPNDRGSLQFVDTYVILRCGRLFGSVSCSTFTPMNVESSLKDLAAAVASRMRAVAG